MEAPPNTVQHWEGVIDALTADTVYARLLDVTGRALVANESVEMPRDNFTEKMLGVMRPGTLFAWFIHNTPEGAASTIRLHTATWTQEEIDAANAAGAERANRLRFD